MGTKWLNVVSFSKKVKTVLYKVEQSHPAISAVTLDNLVKGLTSPLSKHLITSPYPVVADLLERPRVLLFFWVWGIARFTEVILLSIF